MGAVTCRLWLAWLHSLRVFQRGVLRLKRLISTAHAFLQKLQTTLCILMIFRRVIGRHHLIARQLTLSKASRVPDWHRVVLTFLVVQALRLLTTSLEVRLVSGLLMCGVAAALRVLLLIGATFILNSIQTWLMVVCQVGAKALADWRLIEALRLVALS